MQDFEEGGEEEEGGDPGRGGAAPCLYTGSLVVVIMITMFIGDDAKPFVYTGSLVVNMMALHHWFILEV